MSALEDQIAGARTRLDTALDAHAVPLAPPPHRRSALPVLIVAALIAGAVVIAGWLRPDERVAPASPPPGLAEGRYGDEVRILEIDDGDGDPATILLRGDPDAGEVRIYPADGTTTATTAPRPAGETRSPAPEVPPVEVCVESPGAGGLCTDWASLRRDPVLQLGARGAGGQAVVTGVPDDVYAVVYESGPTRRWARPGRGIVVFPRPDEAASSATVVGLAADGGRVFTQSSDDQTLSNPEIEALAASRLSDVTLDAGWFATVPDDGLAGPTVTRLTGRSGGAGFTGPFTAQTYATTRSYSTDDPSNTVWVITVRTDDLADAVQRLRRTGLEARRAIDVAPGVTVLLWAGDAVTDVDVDAAIASLTATAPDPATTLDATTARAWQSTDRAPAMVTMGSPLEALLTDPVATFEGGEIVSQPDDVGATAYWLVTGGPDRRRIDTVVIVGAPGSPDLAPEQLVGMTLSPLLLVVERDVTAVTLATTGGDVEATLVPIDDPVPLQLVVIVPTTADVEVTAVDVTR